MVLKQLAKQYRKQRCSDDGFTLIEVLIAIFVLSIGVLAVGMMQISSINGNKIAFDISEASFQAESELERLLSIPFGDVTDDDGDGSGGLDDNTAGTADDNTTSIDGRYTILRNVADDFPENNTKTIKIIVIWNFKGNSKSLSISSIKAS
jgi:type IV pilus assembly protein PilV